MRRRHRRPRARAGRRRRRMRREGRREGRRGRPAPQPLGTAAAATLQAASPCVRAGAGPAGPAVRRPSRMLRPRGCPGSGGGPRLVSRSPQRRWLPRPAGAGLQRRPALPPPGPAAGTRPAGGSAATRKEQRELPPAPQLRVNPAPPRLPRRGIPEGSPAPGRGLIGPNRGALPSLRGGGAGAHWVPAASVRPAGGSASRRPPRSARTAPSSPACAGGVLGPLCPPGPG